MTSQLLLCCMQSSISHTKPLSAMTEAKQWQILFIASGHCIWALHLLDIASDIQLIFFPLLWQISLILSYTRDTSIDYFFFEILTYHNLMSSKYNQLNINMRRNKNVMMGLDGILCRLNIIINFSAECYWDIIHFKQISFINRIKILFNWQNQC